MRKGHFPERRKETTTTRINEATSFTLCPATLRKRAAEKQKKTQRDLQE
jgi:hypothetical protein